MEVPSGYVCACFFTENVYVRKYDLHVLFHSADTFYADNKTVLERAGCVSSVKIQEVQQLAEDEVARRRRAGHESVERIRTISTKYQRLHAHLYTLKEEFLAVEFLELVRFAQVPSTTFEDLADRVHEYKAAGVYGLPVFRKTFCDELLEELDHFEHSPMPKGRPNTMNNYGVLLNELGFGKSFFDPLREKYLNPLARLLFPDWFGESLDSQRPFVVRYRMEEDCELSWHYDDAEVTLNVCLGQQFGGGELELSTMKDCNFGQGVSVVEHTVGVGVLHRGRQVHRARPITGGERHNLIVWMRSSSIRARSCALCNRHPRLVQVEGFGAGFSPHSYAGEHKATTCAAL